MIYTLYYATNRNHIGADHWKPEKYGANFSSDGLENLRFGKITLDADKNEVDRHVNAKSSDDEKGDGLNLSVYFHEQFKKTGKIAAFVEKLDATPPAIGSLTMFDQVKKEMMKASDVLIFVHGYNVTWREAVSSALALQVMSNNVENDVPPQAVMVILFTWPSDGHLVAPVNSPEIMTNEKKKFKPTYANAYRSDRAEAEVSGPVLARGILKLRDFLIELRQKVNSGKEELCNRSIHLLCHSMGNFVFQNALQRLSIHTAGTAFPCIFEHIFLCAADVDDNVFDRGKPMESVAELANAISIYFNSGDKALWVSDNLKGNPERLGRSGSARSNNLHKKIELIDCSKIVKEGLFGTEHAYFLYGKTNRDIRLSIANLAKDDAKRSRRKVDGTTNEWVLR